jgi:hypothetical protein
MRNVEIKARIDNIEYFAAKASKLASSGPTEILQGKR